VSDVYVPVPPAANLWDVAAIATKALAVLRLGSGDVDVTRVNDAAVTATAAIDSFLDAVEPLTPTANMIARAVQVTCEEYQRPGIAWGVVNAWSEDTVAFRISGDPLAGVLIGLLPDKQRWGIG
jgi:hypothetical protein